MTVTDDPMLKRVEWPLQNFYMRHHNGKKLLELIHNPVSNGNTFHPQTADRVLFSIVRGVFSGRNTEEGGLAASGHAFDFGA